MQLLKWQCPSCKKVHEWKWPDSEPLKIGEVEGMQCWDGHDGCKKVPYMRHLGNGLFEHTGGWAARVPGV